MKTIYQTLIKNYRLLLLSILSLGISSCSSFKNSSYDNNDGIYSSTTSRETTLDNNQEYTQVKQPNVYAEKFKQMEEELYENEYFTDVDAYSSNQVDTVYVIERSYAGWGNNQSDVNVNYYNNGWNNWGYGYNSWYGPGWNNGFYYGNTWGIGINYGWNNWGWNSPYYGYGWNNWYNPYYGYNNYYGGSFYNNNISYNRGRRGMNGYYPANSGRSSNRSATISGRSSQIGNATVRTSRVRTTTTRDNNSINSSGTTRPTRTITSPRSTTTPRTTTTPRSISTPRSTSSPRSSGGTIGGSRSSGGSSGGRSSGGGRGGRG